MKVEYKTLRDKWDMKCEKETLNNKSKVLGLRTRWKGIVIPLTELGERQVWKISRIRNYVLDKFELPIKA